jgi:site-specific DNA recombinase
MKPIRCAIYTRKSSDEGLEQSFNSLDAQREACAAYILSQASEGWTPLPDMYDDGGLSGGTLERPALKRLLVDVAVGKVDIIVVYKVDRLTRSLLDFAKLVEAFDKAGTSFVSVTQSFNTTTSMGRLTLNMLLSFAQFEREVTAERIRDKIAASKAKGMWMGGSPPLGYKPDGRSLAIVEEHAAIIRAVFERYLHLGNVRLVAESLARDGIVSPRRTRIGSGASYGGGPFSRGQIHLLLKCATYIGEVHHKGQIHKGLHQPIIDREVWDKARALLAGHVRGGKRGPRVEHNSVLAGRIVDAGGEPLIASHACKGKVRYRYYVSRDLQTTPGAAGMRLPAVEVETAVATRIARLFEDGIALASAAWLRVSPADVPAFADRCAALRAELSGRSRQRLSALVTRVTVTDTGIEVDCASTVIAQALGVEHQGEPRTLTLFSDVQLRRSGTAMRLIQGDGNAVGATSTASLIKLILKARRWWAILREGEVDIKRLATSDGVQAGYITGIAACRRGGAHRDGRDRAALVGAGEGDGAEPSKPPVIVRLRAASFPFPWGDRHALPA